MLITSPETVAPQKRADGLSCLPSRNIFLKDHRIMSYCTTESVYGQGDYYRAGVRQNLAGP